MKRIGIILICLTLALAGCGPSQQQLTAEQTYYTMLSAVASQQKPLVDIEIANPDLPANIKRIQVNVSQLDALKQYRHIDYAAPWLNVVAAAMPYAGVYLIGKSIGDAFKSGDTYYQAYGQGSSIRTAGNMHFGTVGSSNTIGGMFEVNQSYNPATTVSTETVTTTTTDTTTTTAGDTTTTTGAKP